MGPLLTGAFLIKLLALTAVFFAALSPWRRALKVMGPAPVRPALGAGEEVLQLVPVPAPAPPQPTILESDDPVEQRLVATLGATPDDRAARLVYGDWLEGRGEIAKANFVRGAETLADLPHLLATTSVAWRATTSDERVACMTALCPDRWTAFEAIANDPRRRRCPRCATTMFYAANRAEADGAQAFGDLTLLDLVDVVAQPRGFDTSDLR